MSLFFDSPLWCLAMSFSFIRRTVSFKSHKIKEIWGDFIFLKSFSYLENFLINFLIETFKRFKDWDIFVDTKQLYRRKNFLLSKNVITFFFDKYFMMRFFKIKWLGKKLISSRSIWKKLSTDIYNVVFGMHKKFNFHYFISHKLLVLSSVFFDFIK